MFLQQTILSLSVERYSAEHTELVKNGTRSQTKTCCSNCIS